jgi:hypothetical protein
VHLIKKTIICTNNCRKVYIYDINRHIKNVLWRRALVSTKTVMIWGYIKQQRAVINSLVVLSVLHLIFVSLNFKAPVICGFQLFRLPERLLLQIQ